MLHYVCHVRHKDGDTGLAFYQGDMPRAGETVEVVVHGETIKGRVAVVSVPQRKTFDPAIHIYVEEV
jgi:hypothetical protein